MAHTVGASAYEIVSLMEEGQRGESMALESVATNVATSLGAHSPLEDNGKKKVRSL